MLPVSSQGVGRLLFVSSTALEIRAAPGCLHFSLVFFFLVIWYPVACYGSYTEVISQMDRSNVVNEYMLRLNIERCIKHVDRHDLLKVGVLFLFF